MSSFEASSGRLPALAAQLVQNRVAVLVPAGGTIMGLLLNPAVPALAELASRGLKAAAQAIGLQLHVLHASSERF